jgi:anaerobic selenocysteine-containing dehydrogenase
MLEDEDIEGSYLHDFIHYVKAVFDAPGEAWSDYRIFAELGTRLSPPIRLPEPEEIFRAALEGMELGISLEELKERKFYRPSGPMVAYEGMIFDYPDSKCRFPAELHVEPPSPDGYPLRLLSLIRRDFIHSQIPEEHQESPPTAWVAPDCPALTSLDRERKILLASPLGKMEIRLELMAGLHPESVVYRRGDWMKLGGGVNRIIAAGMTDIGRGAPYYQQYVRLENG